MLNFFSIYPNMKINYCLKWILIGMWDFVSPRNASKLILYMLSKMTIVDVGV